MADANFADSAGNESEGRFRTAVRSRGPEPLGGAGRNAERKSILDLVGEDTLRLQGTLGRTDRCKLDEYLYAIREIEKRIEKAEEEHPDFVPAIEKPAGVPVLFADCLKLMFDL